MDSLRIIILLFSFFFCSYGQDERCPGEGWVRYSDAKCFILVKTYSSGTDASSVCLNESPDANLAVINSQEEQNYLTNYIFNESSVTINVWFGLQKQDDDIVWIDGSLITYTNWLEGNPTNETGRDCIEMVSQFQKLVEGEWKDASCEKPNYVICEKMQTWSPLDLQKELVKLRVESSWKINQLNDEVSRLNTETEELKANPVPIGFIYVQLKDQPLPSVTWPEVTWTEISSDYAGLFFRVAGGNAEDFGTLQGADTQRISRVVSNIANAYRDSVYVTPGQWSEHLFTGTYSVGEHWSISFYQTNSEIRPYNTAMRIWKRTA